MADGLEASHNFPGYQRLINISIIFRVTKRHLKFFALDVS